MDLTILGSAAAEGWPALFCECDVCRKARALGGKDIRRRTSYRLGDRIQIDWGPDTFAACAALGLDTSAITDLLVTHAHEDHFTPHEFFYRRPGFSLVAEARILTVHGPPGVGDALAAELGDDPIYRISFDPLEAYEERELADGVRVTAIPAAHAPDIGGAFNYLLRIGERRLLLGNDTGWWDDDVWDFLGTVALDVVIMDCTYGSRRARAGHLGAPDVVEVREELLSRGALQEKCRVVANHFSHNGGWLHEELEHFLGPHDIDVGYDGMIVRI